MIEKVAKRKDTAESLQYEQDAAKMRLYSEDRLRVFRDLYPIVKLVAFEIPKVDNERVKSNAIKKSLIDDTDVQVFLNDLDNPELSQKILTGLVAIGLGKDIGRVESAVTSVFNEIFIKQEISKETENVTSALPSGIFKYLPKNLIIKTDPNNMIEHVTDRYQQQYETIGKKIEIQKKILEKYTEIKETLHKDLSSENEVIRLSALIMSIILETGIRPGKAGTKVKAKGSKSQKENQDEMATFGATTLLPEHVNFIKDSEVELKFPGKAGTLNVTKLTNTAIMNLLKDYVRQAQQVSEGDSARDTRAIFITSDGKTINQDTLKKYLKRLGIQGLKATDFRKLRSTQAVIASLHGQLEMLYNKIGQFVANQTENLKERIVEEIINTIDTAYKSAEGALSHDNVTTTIGHYINPEVLLRFLSTGGIEDNLKAAIVDNKSSLSFNIEAFIQKAMDNSNSTNEILKVSSDAPKKTLDLLFKVARLAGLAKNMAKTVNKSTPYTFQYV